MDHSACCYLHGVGTAVPARWLDAQSSYELFRQACHSERTARLLRRVVRLTGIDRRHLAVLDYQFDAQGRDAIYRPVAEQPHGPGMGVRNALFERAAAPLVREALSAFPAPLLAGVGTLITASCTHASSPGLERPVFRHSAVPHTADRWNLGFMGCSAALAALRLVRRLAAPPGDALIVACELSSLHFQYSDRPDQLTANVLFADGAAAALLSSRRSAVRVVDCRCVTLPAEAGQMVWLADDHGLRLELSQELPDTLAAALPGAVDDFLAANGAARADVDFWLAHPGGPQILDAVESSLALPPDALAISRDVLRRYGNMSSPTILFILRELLETRRDGTCLAMSFGPGLTIEMALLRLDRGPLA